MMPLLIIWNLFCVLVAVCFSRKKAFHLFIAIVTSILWTPLGGYLAYRFIFNEEIKAERASKRRYEATGRSRQQAIDWYISRIPDDEIDRINNIPSHAERVDAVRDAIQRIMAEDSRNPAAAPVPPP